MKTIVCIKQVPDTREVTIDPKTGSLVREGVPSIINIEDKHAIEAALALRDEHGGEVTVLSMGPPQAEEALREALAMGADRVILVGDRAFAGADTAATSYTLAKAVENIGPYDLILCGREAIDGNTSQVGPQLAEILGLPQFTFARKITVQGDTVEVERALDEDDEVAKTKLPALVTVIKEMNNPRFAPFDSILAAYQEKQVENWNAETLGGAQDENFGLKGSPTKIRKSAAAEFKGKNVEMLAGSAGEVADRLAALFVKEQIV